VCRKETLAPEMRKRSDPLILSLKTTILEIWGQDDSLCAETDQKNLIVFVSTFLFSENIYFFGGTRT
jgi:hypothetical protein